MKTRSQETEARSQKAKNAGNETPAPVTGSYRLWADFYRIGVYFYRLATGFSHFETPLTRLFPHKSTQVVDFPRLAMVRLFWGGVENGFSIPNREVLI